MDHRKIHDHLVQIYGAAGYNEITTKHLRYLNESETVWEIDVEAKIMSRLHIDEIFHSTATNNTFDGRTQIINEPAYPADRNEKLMKTQTFIRKPFNVNAVQVTPKNAAEIAEWCKGEVGQADYKVMGQKVKLICVLVPGNGPKKGQKVEALIGSWVVEHNQNFRVYRDQQLNEQFVQRVEDTDPSQYFHIDDLVQDRDESDGVYQGRVVRADQVLVEYPFRGIIAHDRQELIRIREYSEQTKKAWVLAAQADKGVPYNEALEKINALRAMAESSMTDEEINQKLRENSIGCFPPVEGQLTEPVAVEEINGIRKGMRVIVKLDSNYYVGDSGTVVGLGHDGVRVLVLMDEDSKVEDPNNPPVVFQADELEVIVPEFESGDMIETLIEHEFDGMTIPVGTNGRVTVVGVLNEPNTQESVEVLFSSGHYHHFLPQHLKKI